MSRKIKFRIWDRQAETFISNELGTHCMSHWCLDVFSGELIDFVASIKDPNNRTVSSPFKWYIRGGKIIKKPRYVVQQYTGIKDKRGTKIYEGDIVTGEFYDTEYHCVENVTHPVTWKDGAYNISCNLWWKPSLKVVGNIFQKKNLIK